MLCVRLSQIVTVCSQGLRLSRAVQCPPSAIARREFWWWREAPRQTQTHQLLKQPFLLPCCPPSDCSDTLAWHGDEACDNCCEDRIERYAWRVHEPSMFAGFQRLCEVGEPASVRTTNE